MWHITRFSCIIQSTASLIHGKKPNKYPYMTDLRDCVRLASMRLCKKPYAEELQDGEILGIMLLIS